MAGPFYVDSVAGSNTSPYDTWAKAATATWNLPTLASGEIVYVSSRHVDADQAAAKALIGPTSGAPALLYSVTVDTTTYATGGQIKTTGGAYDMTFNGSFALHGLTLVSGRHIKFDNDLNETMWVKDCTLKPGSGNQIQTTANALPVYLRNCTIDLTNDASGVGTQIFSPAVTTGGVHMLGGSIINASNRTGLYSSLVYSGPLVCHGVDLSALNSTLTLVGDLGDLVCNSCKMPGTYTLAATAGGQCTAKLYNCTAGALADRLSLTLKSYTGLISSATSIVLSGGATTDDGVGGTQAFSHKIVSASTCNENSPCVTDWFYVWNDTTGSRNLDIYVGAAETLDNTEIWAEYLYLGTDDAETYTFVATKRATNEAAATYTTTGGTWDGIGAPTEEYYLRSAVTINEKGWVMGRVCVGKASLTVYVDPRIVLS